MVKGNVSLMSRAYNSWKWIQIRNKHQYRSFPESLTTQDEDKKEERRRQEGGSGGEVSNSIFQVS